MRAHRVVAPLFAIAALGIGSIAWGQSPAPSTSGTLAPPPAAPPAGTTAQPYGPPPNGAQPYGPVPCGGQLPCGQQPYGAPPPYGTQPYGAVPYGPSPYGYPQGYQPYGPVWSAPGTPEGKKPPKKMAYEEGAPIPLGYHLEERTRVGPVIAGAIVGGIGYVIVALPILSVWDEIGNSTRALAVPVLGPWITLATYERCSSNDGICWDGLINMVLVLDGAMQATGAALLTWGLTSKKQYLIRDDVAVAPRITRFGPTSFGSNSFGLTIGGQL